MRKWLSAVAYWSRFPSRSGIAELDLQIGKLRALRDSYQTSLQEQNYYQTEDAKKSGEQLCRS
jgi:hypothetical protein